jgi:hypothetical protein
MNRFPIGYNRRVVEAAIQAWAAELDLDALARRYRDDDGLVVLPRLLPAPLVATMADEARGLRARAVRKRVPFVRQAEAVSHPHIVAHAPTLHALHQSPSLLALFARVAGVPLAHREPDETHASALYIYSRRGDWMDWHYDECGVPAGESFSTIVGLIDDSTSRLEFETGRVQRSLRTVPGTFAFFCGTRAHHRVTPLDAGEERVTFAFTYLREGRKSRGMHRFRQRIGNTLYFGLGDLFR